MSQTPASWEGIPAIIAKKPEQAPPGESGGGTKLDFGKAPVQQGAVQYFPRAVAAVAQLSGFGAEKYTWAGWEKVPDGINRFGNAGARHQVAEAIEGIWDSAWKRDYNKDVLHATAVAWNSLARLELIIRQLEGQKLP